MRKEFRLPDPGEGLTDADIVTWMVAPGDAVAVNQPVCEIETAKSLVELPSPWDGTVLELLVAEGANVAVGEPILAVEVAGAEPESTQPQATQTPAPGGEAGSGATLVGYGNRPAEGARRRLRRAAPEPAAVASQPAAPTPAASARPAPAPAAPTRPAAPVPAAPARPAPAPVVDDPRVLAKPPVRKLAKDLGVDLAAIRGSGPGGIITRDDVVQYANEARPETYASHPGDEPWLVGGLVSPDGRRTRVPVRSVRRRTAEAMVSSAFTAPHVSVFHTVDVTRTMELLARLKEDREFKDLRLTPLLFAMKALLIAVHRHPEINASWDDEAQEIVYKHYVNLGIAASTNRGLMVPNIKDAHRMTLKELAEGLAALTASARASTLTPADMSDGTITITNVGVFGIDTGTPILNPGESAILAFGAIREMPWVVDGQVVPRHVTQLALSFDHRLVDGELGSRVLADVAKVLQDPGHGLVWS